MESIQSQSKTLAVRRTVCYIVLIILTILSLFPFYVMIINATRSHAQVQGGFSALPGNQLVRNIINLVIPKGTQNPLGQKLIAAQNFASPLVDYAKNYPVMRCMLNSIIIAALTACVTTYFSAMTSYGIYMYNFKGRKFAFNFIMAVMMVPVQVSTLGFLNLLQKLNLINNYVSLIIPSVAAPVVFFYMYQSMEATLPYSIVEAARVDGCHEFKTFNQIVLPMMKPAIAVQAIFAFVTSWNNYFVPALVINDKKLWTVPILIANVRNADYLANNMAITYLLLTFAVVPLIVIYLFLSKYIIGGVTAGGVKE